MEALDEVDNQTCKGCGGDLTVELTDKPPYEDDGGGHFHRFHHYWCRGCVDRARVERKLRKDDESTEGTNLDSFPSARFLVPERLPIPTDL